MEDQRQVVLRQAAEMFMRYGLKPVTMDDLARELGMSKKTLYQHVSGKEDLVQQTVKALFAEAKGRLDEALARSGNAIDQLFSIDEVVCQNIENYHHGLQFQLRRYYPEVHRWLEEQRQAMITATTHKNIAQGQKEGLYRSDLNVEIITLLYYSRMVVLTGQEIDPFKDYETKAVMREILVYHINGLATDAGRQYLQSKITDKA